MRMHVDNYVENDIKVLEVISKEEIILGDNEGNHMRIKKGDILGIWEDNTIATGSFVSYEEDNIIYLNDIVSFKINRSKLIFKTV